MNYFYLRNNKSFSIIAVALCLGLTSSACHAKLGDTYDQCVAAYGQPISKDVASLKSTAAAPPSLTTVTFSFFSYNNIDLIIGFMNGAVCYEKMWKEGDAKITHQEFVDTVKAEGDHFEWTSDGRIGKDDGQVHVIFPDYKGALIIFTADYFMACKQAITDKDSQSLSKGQSQPSTN